jgi:deazaflavin-dependent oxidoreductase (nitroreductase family)
MSPTTTRRRSGAETFSALAANAEPGSATARFVTAVSKLHARAYRASRGRVGARMGDAQVCLLTTTGRRSGQSRRTTIGCARLGEDLVLVASNSGADRHPAWYLNLRDAPHVRVRLGRTESAGIARTATGEERDRLWQMITAAAPVMDDYQRRTARELPVVVITPIG